MIVDERGLVLSEDITKGRENSPIPAIVPIDVVDSIFTKLCPEENQASSTIEKWKFMREATGRKFRFTHALKFGYIPANRADDTYLKPAKYAFNEDQLLSCDCQDECLLSTCSCKQRTYEDNLQDYFDPTSNEMKKRSHTKTHKSATMQRNFPFINGRLKVKELPDDKINNLSTGIIYQCNRKCSCPKEKCTNSVTNKGVSAKLKLTLSDDLDRGWHIVAVEEIEQGTNLSCFTGLVRLSGVRSNNPNQNKYTFRADSSINDARQKQDRLRKESLPPENNNAFSVKMAFQNHHPPESDGHFRDLYEWINWAELENRDPDSGLRGNYHFDIDAANYGSLTRFFNHECNSNKLRVQLLYGERNWII